MVNAINIHPAPGHPLNIISPGTKNIIAVLIPVNVIQVTGVAVNNDHPGSGHKISYDAGPDDVNFRDKTPVI
jgi:hypothetical protein